MLTDLRWEFIFVDPFHIPDDKPLTRKIEISYEFVISTEATPEFVDLIATYRTRDGCRLFL